MSINSVNRGDWYGKPKYELVCDKCGHRPIREGSKKECISYAKQNKWKISSSYPFRKGSLFSHLCQFCNQTEWKNLEVKP